MYANGSTPLMDETVALPGSDSVRAFQRERELEHGKVAVTSDNGKPIEKEEQDQGQRCDVCGKWIRSLDESFMRWHKETSARCLQKQGVQRKQRSCGEWVVDHEGFHQRTPIAPTRPTLAVRGRTQA